MNKLVPLYEIFKPIYGVNLELIYLQECEKNHQNSIRFISRSEKNNGVTAYVKKVDGIIPNPPHTISVAVSGSVLSAFYQNKEYYSGRDLYYLQPYEVLTVEEMLFYVYCIRSNKYKYNYGRGANRTLKDILIPDKIPTQFKAITINNIQSNISESPLLSDNKKLFIYKWKSFNLTEIFYPLIKCKCSSAIDLLSSGEDVYYIGAKKNDNGIMSKVQYDNELISKGNCIVFICDGKGSIGYTLY